MKPSNIREFIWKVIDTDLSIKKDVSRGLINVRALANYIIRKHKLKVAIDSVISAIRRYPFEVKGEDKFDAHGVLKKAKISTITKMASISLKKNEETTSRLGDILPKVNYEEGETLRVIEGAKLFKILIDKNSFNKIFDVFGKKNVLESNKNIGMIEISYPDILKKTPGVFSAISTELGENSISIIDALIISHEHIIIVDERDLLKAFDLLYSLCN